MVLGAVGFTGAGITASSLAAKMMSVSAIANGGGVAAGSMVATLQSVGKCPRWARRTRASEGPAQVLAQRVSGLCHPPGPLAGGRREPRPGCVGSVGAAQRVRRVTWSVFTPPGAQRPLERRAASRSRGDPGTHPTGELPAAARPEQRSWVWETQEGAGWVSGPQAPLRGPGPHLRPSEPSLPAGPSAQLSPLLPSAGAAGMSLSSKVLVGSAGALVSLVV